VEEDPERPERVVLVVPCYEEAGRLDASAFLDCAETRPGLRFVFVDDGSRDATPQVLAALRDKAGGRVEVLTLPANAGKAEAVRHGVLHALASDAELVGFWDADLATPLAELDRFVAAFRADPALELLLGSRVRMLGHAIDRNPLRHYFGRVAATIVSNLLGIAVYDTQCGAKLFRAGEPLRRVFAPPFLTRWIFDVEILARWLEQRRADPSTVERHVRELPVSVWRDVEGTRLRAGDFLRVPVDLLRIALRHGIRRGVRPE
jgi:glycosyltransferase involved in cell wall biosynthesis